MRRVRPLKWKLPEKVLSSTILGYGTSRRQSAIAILIKTFVSIDVATFIAKKDTRG